MVNDVDWVSVAAVVSAVCAVIAAAVSVWIWRSLRSGDIGRQIHEGDTAVRTHVDRTIGAIAGQLSGVRDAVARMEARQATEEKHVLRPRDLNAIHDRMNKLAEEAASSRAQATTETRMIGEQLRVLQRLIQDISNATRRTLT